MAKPKKPTLMKAAKPSPKMSPKMMGEGTNRAGRIEPVGTDRGDFRFKKNRAGD